MQFFAASTGRPQVVTGGPFKEVNHSPELLINFLTFLVVICLLTAAFLYLTRGQRQASQTAVHTTKHHHATKRSRGKAKRTKQ